MTPAPPIRPWRRTRGRAAHADGHRGEWLAAAWLMLKGYRVLGFRLRTRRGEIDLLAVRGRTLAVVEVKRRATMEQALDALSAEQAERLRAAAGLLTLRPSLRRLTMRGDLVALAPGRLPRHKAGAWSPT